ncbi:hypothetical protein BDF21DRAFT_322193, partial [Thamnidium elegans]
STRAVSYSVIGAISAIVPQAKGTTTGHYLNSIRETLNIMDIYPEMKGFYLIMNNAPIHSS